VDLGFTQVGRVSQVLVKEGDRVKAGDVLAKLDPAPLQAAVDQAQAALDTANANLQSAQTRADQVETNAQSQAAAGQADAWKQSQPSEISQPPWYFQQSEQITATLKEVDTAKANLATEQANLQSVLKQASSADLVAAETRMANAQAAFLVAKDVLDRANATGNKDLENQAQNHYDAAKTELDAAQKNYDQMLSTQGASDVLEARARLAVAQEAYNTAVDRLTSLRTGDQSLDVRLAQESVQQAQSAVTQAQGSLNAAQVALQEATLTAPADGTLAQVDIQPGEIANPGKEEMILMDTSSWKVQTTDLSEADVTRVKPGMKATITLDAFPNRTFTGQVEKIAMISQDTRGSVTYQATLSFDPGDAAVRPGMTAYVDITTNP
jgi:HlyD family secretion protein